MAENSKWQFQSNLEITGSYGGEETVEVDKKRQISLGAANKLIKVTDHKTKTYQWFSFWGAGGGSIMQYNGFLRAKR